MLATYRRVAAYLNTVVQKTTRLRSLAVRLIAFGVCLSVLGLFGYMAVLSSVLQGGIQELVTANLLAEGTHVAKDIDGKILVRRQLLESLAKDLPVALLDQPQQLEDWLAERHNLNPLFSLGLVVVPPDGHGAIADFPLVAGRRQLDFASSDWFLSARDKTRFAIGKPAVGRVTQQGIIVLAAPILDAQGRVAAVIQGTTALDAPGFLDLIQNNPIGNTGGYLLISPRDNIFVAASMPKMRLRPLPPPGTNPMHDRVMAGFRGTGITVNAYGVEELVAMVSVPAADWFVVARMPTAEAFQTVDKIRYFVVRNSMIITLTLAAALLFFLGYMFRPLQESARQMRRMTDGNTPLAPLPVVWHDEVGEMAKGFNYLLEKLRESSAEKAYWMGRQRAFNYVLEKLRESEARLTHLAHHDALTGLPNRPSFLARIQQGVALAQRQKGRLALMFVDLDGFKPINDIHGHEAGDQLLQQVAARLNESVRQSDAVARFGGDEFVLLLTDIPDRENVAAVAEKLIARLSMPYAINQLELRIGASIGIALFPEDAEDIDTLIAQADAAMYDAKRGGRNCHRFAHKQG